MKKSKLIFLIPISIVLLSCNIKETEHYSIDTEIATTIKESDVLKESEVLKAIEKDVESISNHIFEVEIESLKENLLNLCRFPRHYLSEQKDDSIQYLLNKLIEYGYEPIIQEFNIYERDFICNFADNIFEVNPLNSEVLGTGKNIIATHNGNKNGQKTLYITAHYDTTSYTTGVIDNGTGSVIVLELAKVLQEYDSGLNLIFILFDTEEACQQGSIAFIRNLSESDKTNALGCINIDMVGEIDAGDIVMKFGTSEHNIISILWNEIQDQNIDVKGGVGTDEIPFYRAGIPTVTIINELPHYGLDKENTQAQLEHIDFVEMANVTKQICRFIKEFSQEYYNDLLSNKITLNSNIGMDKVYTITNASFEKNYAKIVDNGFMCETQYHYIYTTGEKFSVNIAAGCFYDNDDFHDYSIIENPDPNYTFYYKINEDDDESVRVRFYNGAIYGTITSDFEISEEILDEITHSFIESYNTTVFGQ